jgi:hypothetical protein
MKTWRTTNSLEPDLEQILTDLELSGWTIFQILSNGPVFTIVYFQEKVRPIMEA